jgi:ribose 5-phosphate isomerase B
LAVQWLAGETCYRGGAGSGAGGADVPEPDGRCVAGRPQPAGDAASVSDSVAFVRIYLGSDHAGFALKGRLIEWLEEAGHEAVDCGPAALEEDDDYPPYVMRAAAAAIADPGSMGIIIGGSGNGEQIAANKVRGVRAALAWSAETARLARLHNDANVLSIGARMHTIEDAVGFAQVFVETPFSGAARHAARLQMITDYEETGKLPALPG